MVHRGRSARAKQRSLRPSGPSAVRRAYGKASLREPIIEFGGFSCTAGRRAVGPSPGAVRAGRQAECAYRGYRLPGRPSTREITSGRTQGMHTRLGARVRPEHAIRTAVRGRPWKADGYADRFHGADLVRYASVDGATQRSTALRSPRRAAGCCPCPDHASPNSACLQQVSLRVPFRVPISRWRAASSPETNKISSPGTSSMTR